MTQPHTVGPAGLMLTAKEAAAQLRLSVRTVTRYRSQGKFPGAWRQNAQWRIPQGDIDAYIRRQQTSS